MPKKKDTLTVIVDCPAGFYDMKVLKERVPLGGQVEVSVPTYKQMKQSDPSVTSQEKRLALNEGALERIREASKEAIEEIEEAVEELEEVVEETEKEEEQDGERT